MSPGELVAAVELAAALGFADPRGSSSRCGRRRRRSAGFRRRFPGRGGWRSVGASRRAGGSTWARKARLGMRIRRIRKRALLTTRGRLRCRASGVQPTKRSRGAVFQAAAPKPNRARLAVGGAGEVAQLGAGQGRVAERARRRRSSSGPRRRRRWVRRAPGGPRRGAQAAGTAAARGRRRDRPHRARAAAAAVRSGRRGATRALMSFRPPSGLRQPRCSRATGRRGAAPGVARSARGPSRSRRRRSRARSSGSGAPAPRTLRAAAAPAACFRPFPRGQARASAGGWPPDSAHACISASQG